MKEVKQLEKILGHSYGKIPKIKKRNIWNIYQDKLQTENYGLIKGFLEGISYAIEQRFDKSKAFYNPATHTIFTPQKNNKLEEYAMYHELGHGYVNQINKSFLKITQEYCQQQKEMLYNDKEISLALFEKYLIYLSIDEGLADYLTIQAQKLDLNEGKRKLEEVICFKVESNLSNSPLIDKKTPIPLNHSSISNLMMIGKSLIIMNGLFNGSNLLNKLKLLNTLNESLKKYPYFLGHYFVKTRLKNKSVNIGEKVDELIINPPQNIDDMFNEIYLNLKNKI